VFERFTDRARTVLIEARAEAVETGVGFIGTEHLLIGMLREGTGLAAIALEEQDVGLARVREKVLAEIAGYIPVTAVDDASALAAIGIDIDAVRTAVETAFGEGALPDRKNQPPFTPRGKSALERSLAVSLAWRQRFIGTEHLLVGLLELGQGIAVSVLKDLGTDLEALRDSVKRLSAPEALRADVAWQGFLDLARQVSALPGGARRDELLLCRRDGFEAMTQEQAAITGAATALADHLEVLTESLRQALDVETVPGPYDD
jgi:ATP-dependent Clp protease ATP-binding subunit ClpA